MSVTAFQVLGMDVWTMPELLDVLMLISTEDEAAEFLAAYEIPCGDETAIHNLRYMLNLIGGEEASRLAELFMVELPATGEVLSPRQTFGRTSLGVDMSKPLPDYTALEASQRHGAGSWAKGRLDKRNENVLGSSQTAKVKPTKMRRVMMEA